MVALNLWSMDDAAAELLDGCTHESALCAADVMQETCHRSSCWVQAAADEWAEQLGRMTLTRARD